MGAANTFTHSTNNNIAVRSAVWSVDYPPDKQEKATQTVVRAGCVAFRGVGRVVVAYLVMMCDGQSLEGWSEAGWYRMPTIISRPLGSKASFLVIIILLAGLTPGRAQFSYRECGALLETLLSENTKPERGIKRVLWLSRGMSRLFVEH
jgi:hypothetical protein